MSGGAATRLPLDSDMLDQGTDALPTMPVPAPVVVVPPKQLRLRDADAGRRQRRAIPIRFMAGSNGHGKSLAAVHDLLPSLDAGRKVLSTVVLLDAETGEPHKHFELFEDFSQIMSGSHFDVLADEVMGVASSRQSQSMDGRVSLELQKLRKRDATFTATGPTFQRADIVIREVTQGITTCEGFLQKAPPPDEDGVVSLWKQRRLFRLRTYEGKAFDQTEAEKAGESSRTAPKPLQTSWLWRPGSRAERSYDTLGAVSMVSFYGVVNGTCMACGGVRRKAPCSCGKSH